MKMKTLTKNNVELLSESIRGFFDIKEYKNIIQFALEDIDLSDDVSAANNKLNFDKYPYLLEPLNQCTIEKGKRKEVVFAAPEQMGKTTLELCTILYNCVYNQLQALAIMPTVELSVQTSNTKFIPLFKRVPQFKEDIEKPFAIRGDRLKLSNALIYWGSAATKILSKSCALILGDEVAQWKEPEGVNNIEEAKKRTRSYNECLSLFVSTPSFKENKFWREFLKGSQAYYFLRCQHCGQLTIRSCDIHNLQWDSDYNEELKQYVAVRGSVKLICPKCKHEHEEDERYNMISQGGYIHTYPERAQLFPTYQVGALASMLSVHDWTSIADLQLSAGRGADFSDFCGLDNSIRGLPFQDRNYNLQDETAISKHFYDTINPDDIEAVYVVADTQDTFSPFGVAALTKTNNVYILEMGRLRYLWLEEDERKVINAENKRNGKPPETTLLDKLDQAYFGIKPLCLFVDMRGHRTEEVKNFAKIRKNILMYGGTNLKYDKWKISDNNKKLFLCDARKFQSELIYLLYYQQYKDKNYLYLPKTLTKEDIEQITTVQPDKTKRNGNLFENWEPVGVHDFFDVLKQTVAIMQISGKIYRRERFKFGEAKWLNFRKVDEKPKVKIQSAPHKKLFNWS